MGMCCCKESDHDGWYFSTESVPPLDIDCKLDWSGLPNISPPNYPLTEKEIADLYQKEYRSYNKYKM
jgi:hypothetical protein